MGAPGGLVRAAIFEVVWKRPHPGHRHLLFDPVGRSLVHYHRSSGNRCLVGVGDEIPAANLLVLQTQNVMHRLGEPEGG